MDYEGEFKYRINLTRICRVRFSAWLITRAGHASHWPRMKTMIVTAWNNGRHCQSGAGYGLKIASEDRDKYFDRNWPSVFVQIEGTNEEIEVNIHKKSFWTKICRELVSKEIGLWLRQTKLAPWPKGNLPQLVLLPLEGSHFRLRRN